MTEVYIEGTVITVKFILDIAKGPFKQHKANQIIAYVSTLEHRQKRLLGSNAKVLKLDILCVDKEYMGFVNVVPL